MEIDPEKYLKTTRYLRVALDWVMTADRAQLTILAVLFVTAALMASLGQPASVYVTSSLGAAILTLLFLRPKDPPRAGEQDVREPDEDFYFYSENEVQDAQSKRESEDARVNRGRS